MNQLSSRNRKLVYMLGILVLLVPIGVLGMPATEPAGPNETQQSGGKIAELRHQHKLGETTLGDVDPASATMNLVLLGMRGVAGSVLWLQADDQKRKKNWSELEQTIESIIKLQPRFLQVWKFQGWNLAFNVSAECDAVEDRFFWVKKGAKFLIRGTRQNENAAELYHNTGEFFGTKIGRSDERTQFRRFFKSDPDPRFEGLADPEINPENKDNYLVAEDYYEIANEKEQLPGVEQHRMARVLFRSYPGHARMGYAAALESEGKFDELSREAWRRGHDWWTTDYGREMFNTPGGDIMLNASEKDLQRLAEEDENHDIDDKRTWLTRYQNMTNYRYWRTRSKLESEQATIEARKKLYEGKKLFFESKLDPARRHFEEGLTAFEGVFEKYPDLLRETETVEEVLKAQLMWRYILELFNEEVPQDFPLRKVWDDNPQLLAELEELFQRQINTEF